MTQRRSKQDVLDFLDYLAEKGLMARNTVASRKAAVSKVLGVLTDEEANDVTQLDLDEVMGRFHNLQGTAYSPESLRSYLSRLRSTIDDFIAYQENPLGFRPRSKTREIRKINGRKENSREKRAPDRIVERRETKTPITNSILPIPIRPDTTVYIQGIPYDLTDAEASKIANVIRAMATPS